MADKPFRTLILSHLWLAFGAFGLASVLGLYQVLERSGLVPLIESPPVYFASVSTHGVLMAFVLTTFFIMGFGYVVAVSSLKMPLWNPKLAWAGFGVSAFGTVGVSMGLTPTLAAASRVILIVMMYMGRVGVLTLGVAVFMRRREPPRLKYPDADVFMG